MPHETKMRVVDVGLRREIYYDAGVKIAVPEDMTDAEVESLVNQLAGEIDADTGSDDPDVSDLFVTNVSGGLLENGDEPAYRLVRNENGKWALIADDDQEEDMWL